MATPEEINADMLAFWNGKGGDTWVARQENHTDTTLSWCPRSFRMSPTGRTKPT